MEVALESRTRIVCVDDDQQVSRAIQLHLSRLGCEVVAFEDGDPVVEYLEKQLVDVMLLDVHLDNCDSRTLLTRIQKLEQGADLPVFMITGDASAETVKQFLQLNVAGYFLKPFNTQRFMGRLKEMEAVLEQRRNFYFVSHFISNFDAVSDESEKRRLVAQLERSQLMTEFTANPTMLPPDVRVRLAHILYAFFEDLDRMMLEMLDLSNESQTIETLKLIEEIARRDDQQTRRLLSNLVASENLKIASKAVKVLGKTTKDIFYLKPYLLNPNSRFVANLIESLWESDSEESVQVFRRFLDSPTPRIWANSVVGLCRRGYRDEAVESLRLALTGDDLGRLRSGLWACTFLELTELASRITDLTGHPDPEFQERARAALARLNLL